MSFVEWGGDAPEPNLGSSKYERFSAKKGQTYRLAYVWWPRDSSGRFDMNSSKPKFIGGKRVFIENVGYVLYRPELAPFTKNEPKMTVATIVMVVPVTNGNLDQRRLLDGDYKILPWVFAETKYKTLSGQWGEWPPNQHDVTLTCEDEQYQKMTFTPNKNSALRLLMKSTEPRVQSVINDIVGQVTDIERRIANEIARDISVEELRQKLNISSPTPAASHNPITSDVEDALENILEE